jgi:hypothetical protein
MSTRWIHNQAFGLRAATHQAQRAKPVIIAATSDRFQSQSLGPRVRTLPPGPTPRSVLEKTSPFRWCVRAGAGDRDGLRPTQQGTELPPFSKTGSNVYYVTLWAKRGFGIDQCVDVGWGEGNVVAVGNRIGGTGFDAVATEYAP